MRTPSLGSFTPASGAVGVPVGAGVVEPGLGELADGVALAHVHAGLVVPEVDGLGRCRFEAEGRVSHLDARPPVACRRAVVNDAVRLRLRVDDHAGAVADVQGDVVVGVEGVAVDQVQAAAVTVPIDPALEVVVPLVAALGGLVETAVAAILRDVVLLGVEGVLAIGADPALGLQGRGRDRRPAHSDVGDLPAAAHHRGVRDVLEAQEDVLALVGCQVDGARVCPVVGVDARERGDGAPGGAAVGRHLDVAEVVVLLGVVPGAEGQVAAGGNADRGLGRQLDVEAVAQLRVPLRGAVLAAEGDRVCGWGQRDLDAGGCRGACRRRLQLHSRRLAGPVRLSLEFQGSRSAPYHDSGMSSLTHSPMPPDTVYAPCDCSR